MKTEQKYLVFWLSLLSLSSFYFLLILMKFSRFSVQHLVRTCITSMTSIIHFSTDMFPFVIFPLAWLGVLAIVLKVFFSYIKTRTKMKQLTAQQTSQMPRKILTLLSKHSIQQQKIMVVHSNQPFAYTIGIWSSKIVLSSSLISKLSMPELEAVMLHERHHQRHSHTLLFFIGEIVNSVLFLLPVFDDVLISMKLKLEVEADKTVIAYQKTTQHLLTSLQVITSSPVVRYYPGFATYRLEDRVGLLAHRTPEFRPFSIRKIIVSILVVVTSFVVIQMPVNADTSLNPQSGQKCEGSVDKIQKSSTSFPMSYGH